MKRVVRRIVTVVTTETWLVEEDEHEHPEPSETTPRLELPEEDTGHVSTTLDSSPGEAEAPRNGE